MKTPALFRLFPFLALLFFLVATATAQKSTKDLPKIKLDRPAEAKISAGEMHSYRIKLRGGEYLELSTAMDSGGLQVTLSDPAGKECGLRMIAASEGNYRLNVRAEKAGSYTVKIATLRAATEQDRMRLAAEETTRAAELLRKEKKNPEAIEKYSAARAAWQKLGDRNREADMLGELAVLSRSQKDFEAALKYAEEALALRRTLKDRKGEAAALLHKAQAQRGLKQAKAALETYREALPVLRETENRRGEADVLDEIGSAHLIAGNGKAALETFDQALAAWQALADLKGQAGAQTGRGRALEALNDVPKALEAYAAALAHYRAADDAAGQAAILLDLGAVSRDAGDAKKAVEYLEQAVPIWQRLGRKGEEASTHNYLGLAFRTLGDQTAALSHYTQALGIAKGLSNQRLEATVLNNIAGVHYYFGNKRKAIETYDQILPIRRQAGDQIGEASTLTNLGASYADLGENQRALEYYAQALRIWHEQKRVEEAIALQNIAETYDRLGEKQKALDYYNQAFGVVRSFDRKQIEGMIMTNLATVLSSLGEKTQARDLYLRSLESHRARNEATAEADTLHLLGFLHYEMEEYAKALEYLTQALPLTRQLKDQRAEAVTLTALALVYRAQNEPEKSRQHSLQAIELHQAVGNRSGETDALLNLGLLASTAGEKQKAIEHFKRALELSQAISDPALESRGHYEIARVQLDTGQLQDARQQIEEALRIVETLRTKVTSQELRTSYFASVQKYYDFYTDLLMRMHERESGKGHDAEALEASERARARSLLEILAEANANIREGVDAVLIDRERSLQQQINGKADAMARLFARQAPAEQIDPLKKEFDQIALQLAETRAEIRRTSPRYAALTQPAPLRVKEIQTQLLDENTLLLEYALGEERSYLWAVTPTKISSYVLPPRAEIEAAARQTIALLSKPQDAYQTVRKLRHENLSPKEMEERDRGVQAFYALSRMLLRPVASQLPGKRLLVVTSGALQYVPFSALPFPEQPRSKGKSAVRNPQLAIPLIVRNEIVSLPSASTLSVLRRETGGRAAAPKMLAVLADPVFERDDERLRGVKIAPLPAAPSGERLFKHSKDNTGPLRIARLPFTRQEAERILSLVPESDRKQALDFNASRNTALAADLSQYRYIHFATHGFLDSQRPELSALVLSLVNEKGEQQSGFLYSHEVYNLKLPAEVVVLSACETGLGKEIKGEGLVGLTRGFMYAGAPRVVVSLWSVSDRGTAELMGRFYQKMIQEKLRPAAALRAVQIEMWTRSQWKDPYYWAAFALQGEWR